MIANCSSIMARHSIATILRLSIFTLLPDPDNRVQPFEGVGQWSAVRPNHGISPHYAGTVHPGG
jgi:hypothetical protein